MFDKAFGNDDMTIDQAAKAIAALRLAGKKLHDSVCFFRIWQ